MSKSHTRRRKLIASVKTEARRKNTPWYILYRSKLTVLAMKQSEQ